MGAKLTIAQLQAEAEGLYGDYEIDLGGGKTLVLKPLLRLSDEKQNKAYELQDRLFALQKGETKTENVTRDVRAVLHELIRLIAATKAPADAFIKSHGQDVVLLMTLFKGYTEANQVGEAAASPS